MSEREIVEVHDIVTVSADNVSDRNGWAGYPLKPAYFVEERITGRNEQGEYDFTKVSLLISFHQLYPMLPGGDTERTIRFDLTRNEQDSYMEAKGGNKPFTMSSKSPLGQLAAQVRQHGLPDMTHPDFAGQVLVMASWTEEWTTRGGQVRTRRRHDVMTHIGDRSTYDDERMKTLVDEATRGTKEFVTEAVSY